MQNLVEVSTESETTLNGV